MGTAAKSQLSDDRELIQAMYRGMVHVSNFYKSEVGKIMADVSREMGLPGTAKFAHFDVLCEIYHARGEYLSLTDISRSTRVALPNVSNSVSELVELGLLERTVDEQDRRRAIARATDTGRAFGDEVVRRFRGVADVLLGDSGHARSLVALLDETENQIARFAR